ncbi:nitroreductase/quinone reductase family protein [Promicromonospora sukumoe]|uniref:nitroreductase/quinone reductase family protein n=1 Tax=Promicromonospora sukumoe TaxID=88382 RepID=UPI001E4A3729|nr:nitroreductase/quinone reductase family protein [Promicromonospora sukumoe]
MSNEVSSAPRIPPRWFVRLAWQVHRGMYRVSGGRLGLRRPRGHRWGMLRVTTTGRRTGCEHSVILAYLDDGADLVALAMNGWADGEPNWWLNLKVHPEATVDLVGESRTVRAHAAQGAERDRLWAAWRTYDHRLDAYAALRTTETAVVVLERWEEPGHS